MRISDWSSDGCSSDLVWAEVPYLFDPQYRAALAWAEEVTRVSETHASDEDYAAAAAAFEPRDLVDLTIAIAAMNAFNRLGAPFRLPVKAKARVILNTLELYDMSDRIDHMRQVQAQTQKLKEATLALKKG